MGRRGETPRTALTDVFEVVLWGYDRTQVDQCIAELEDRLTALYGEQRRADRLDAELGRSRVEIADLRARLCGVPLVHSVGEEMAHVLRVAERQAVDMRAEAERELVAAHENAARILADAQREADQHRRDCEIALREHRRSQQRRADRLVTAARREADRIVAAAGTATPTVTSGETPAITAAPDGGNRKRPATPERQRSRSASHDARPLPRLGEETA